MENFKTIDIRGLSFFNALQLTSKEFTRINKNGILELLVDKKRNLFTTNQNNSFNLKMFFPNRNEFIDIINNCGFKICDIGYSNFKVFGSYEKEIIISAVKS